MTKRIIFHIDVNSAYLSWEAVYRLQQGLTNDLRNIPSVISGDPKKRTGIILAKSIPAKKYGIKTGESLLDAYKKYPYLKIIAPNYSLYMKCSNAMYKLLKEYSPKIQRYSIDECFLDYTGLSRLFGNPEDAALKIKKRIEKELGFTVNIGISTNKLLAKMASEFKKPNRIHTLYPYELEYKMWPLKVDNLFMVGRATTPKLNKLNIQTIGDLAKSDPKMIQFHLKSHGRLIWDYANGIENSKVRSSNHPIIKGMGNSTTTAFDIDTKKEAYMVLLALCETICMRLRESNYSARLVSVGIKTSEFNYRSHQHKFDIPMDSTNMIYSCAKKLFDASWRGEKIRHLGVRVSELCSSEFYQLSIFNNDNIEKQKILDHTIDNLRYRYGSKSIIRSCFLHSGIHPLLGGTSQEEGDYPVMSSII